MAGTPGQLHSIARMQEAKERVKKEREERARATLGDAATPEQIQAWVGAALNEQKRQKRLANEARKSGQAAQRMLAQAQQGASAPANGGAAHPQHFPPAPGLPPVPTEAAESLYEHSIFGGAVRPDRADKVDLERLPSGRPGQRGVAPEWLEEVEFSIFSKGYVKAQHGGGAYRATVKDAAGRVITHRDFSVSGPAIQPEEEPALQRGRGFAFQPPPEDDAPLWARQMIADNEKRIERLEAIVTQKPASELTPDERFSLWKKEQEEKERLDVAKRKADREEAETKAAAKEEADERKHERRMSELKAQMDADLKRESDRQKDTLTMFTTLMPKPDPSGGMAAMMPMMIEVMKGKDQTVASVFGFMKGLAKGDESPRTWKDRALDILEKSVESAWDSGFLTTWLSGLKKPDAAAVAAVIPAGSAFRLPDGRVVAPEVCGDFIGRYRAKHGVEPSIEVCVASFTAYMNAQQAAQAAAGQAPAQIQGPPQMAGGTPPPTTEQLEEMVRVTAQRAAEAATKAGATPEQASMAAREAERRAIDIINARLAAAHGQQPPPQAAAPTQPARPQAPPQQAAGAAPMAPSLPPAPVAAPAVPQAPPDVVSVPWMARSFMQDAADAFQAGQDPVDFLERAAKMQKISPDAMRKIGEIYDGFDEKVEIQKILSAVRTELESKGVAVPMSLIPVFMGDERGASWIEALLFAAGCDTFEEAREKLAKP